MTNKDKFEKVFGFELPYILETACLNTHDRNCIHPEMDCDDCPIAGENFWGTRYCEELPGMIPKDEVKRIVTSELRDLFDDMLQKEVVPTITVNDVENMLLTLNKKIRIRVLDWKEGGSDAED